MSYFKTPIAALCSLSMPLLLPPPIPSGFLSSSPLSASVSPVPHGKVCPLFPGNVSCNPQPAAGEWSTEKDKTGQRIHTHTQRKACTDSKNTQTLLSSFWYWGIFFSIWERSLIVVCWNKNNTKLHNECPIKRRWRKPQDTPNVFTKLYIHTHSITSLHRVGFTFSPVFILLLEEKSFSWRVTSLVTRRR